VRRGILLCLLLTGLARPVLAQTTIFGTVHDQTGSPLPGVLVELSGPTSIARQTVTDDTGRYGATAQVDTVLHLSLSAGVTVTGLAVVAAGVTVEDVRRVSGSVNLRYFRGRPLVEDGSVKSPTTVIHADGGYAFSPRLRVSVDVFNALDMRASDIDYFYISRLSGEPEAGVADEHLHPALPRTARISLTASF
jgi:hypothetical protein